MPAPPERRLNSWRKPTKPTTQHRRPDDEDRPACDAGEQQQRERGDGHGAGQHERVRAEAAEVLAERDLEPRDRAEQGGAGEQHAVARQHPPHAEHDRRQRAQLDERKAAPRRLRRVVAAAAPGGGGKRRRLARDRGGGMGARTRSRCDALARWRLRRPICCARPSVGSGRYAAMASGHPEDSLTCHQPASIPIRPRRGRTCQTPQPGSPTSAALTRTKRWRPGSRSIRSRSARFSPLALGARGKRLRAPRAGARRGRRGRAPARRSRAGAVPPPRRSSMRCRRADRPRRRARELVPPVGRSGRAAYGARAPPRRPRRGQWQIRVTTIAMHLDRSSRLPRPARSSRVSRPALEDRQHVLRTATAPPRRGRAGRPRPAPRTAAGASCVWQRGRPAAGSPNSGASGTRASATTIRPAGSGSASRRRRVARRRARGAGPARPWTASASSAHIGTPVSTSAIVSASSSSPRETNPPCTRRSIAAASTACGSRRDRGRRGGSRRGRRAAPGADAARARRRPGSGSTARRGARARPAGCAARAAPAARARRCRGRAARRAAPRRRGRSWAAGRSVTSPVSPASSRVTAALQRHRGRLVGAERRAQHDAASVREHDRRADRDPVEVGDGAVAVLGDGEAPAAVAGGRAHVGSVPADRDRGEADAGMADRDLLHRIERVDAAARALGEERRARRDRGERACSC